MQALLASSIDRSASKRKKAAALHDLADGASAEDGAKRLGVRQASGAFPRYGGEGESRGRLGLAVIQCVGL